MSGEFPDYEWRRAVEALPYPEDLKDWALLQVSRGQSYYVNRVDRLGLSGGSVLDAGCGVGNWSMGLARRFQRVYALEIDRLRLRAVTAVAGRFHGTIVPVTASVEALPFPHGCFDAIFCNGVIFLTDYRKSLGEFFRVLKPGGQMYLTYNTKQWWDHILRDRGPTEPVCITYACNAYLCLLLRYFGELDLGNRLSAACRAEITRQLVRSFSGWSLPTAFLPPAVLARGFRSLTDEPADTARFETFEKTAMTAIGREIALIAASDCTVSDTRKLETAIGLISILRAQPEPAYRRAIVLDLVSRASLGRPCNKIWVQTHSFEPDEMMSLLQELGFRRFATSWEGTLALADKATAVTPIYRPDQGVFEIIASRER